MLGFAFVVDVTPSFFGTDEQAKQIRISINRFFRIIGFYISRLQTIIILLQLFVTNLFVFN